jgi:hypothetical protein
MGYGEWQDRWMIDARFVFVVRFLLSLLFVYPPKSYFVCPVGGGGFDTDG